MMEELEVTEQEFRTRLRDLEHNYNDINASLARLHTKVDFVVDFVKEQRDTNERVESRMNVFDRWQAKAIGIALGVSAAVSTLLSWLFSYLRLKGHSH